MTLRMSDLQKRVQTSGFWITHSKYSASANTHAKLSQRPNPRVSSLDGDSRGATKISCFFERIRRKVKSFVGSMSRTDDLRRSGETER